MRTNCLLKGARLTGKDKKAVCQVRIKTTRASYSNVQVAAVYLDYLRGRLAPQGHPEKEWMLVAYNWGPDRLNDFLAGGGAWADLPEARRRYAEDILRIAQTIP